MATTTTKTTNEKEMKRLAKKYTKLQAQIKALEDEKNKLRDEMVAILEAEETTAMSIDEYTVRNTDVDIGIVILTDSVMSALNGASYRHIAVLGINCSISRSNNIVCYIDGGTACCRNTNST